MAVWVTQILLSNHTNSLNVKHCILMQFKMQLQSHFSSMVGTVPLLETSNRSLFIFFQANILCDFKPATKTHSLHYIQNMFLLFIFQHLSIFPTQTHLVQNQINIQFLMHKSNKGHLQMPHHSAVGDIGECTSIISLLLKVKTFSFLLIHIHTHTHIIY